MAFRPGRELLDDLEDTPQAAYDDERSFLFQGTAEEDVNYEAEDDDESVEAMESRLVISVLLVSVATLERVIFDAVEGESLTKGQKPKSTPTTRP